MIRSKHLVLAFIPAIAVAAFGLFLVILEYEPLYPADGRDSRATAFQTIPVSPDDPILGDRRAADMLIVFADYGCEDCRALDAVLSDVLKEYPKKIAVAWKGLPVTKFPVNTARAHLYGYCANQQKKFDAFRAYAFLNADALSEATLETIAEKIGLAGKKLATCLSSGAGGDHTAKVEALAAALQVQAVPAVFWNNEQITPPASLRGWEELLNLK